MTMPNQTLEDRKRRAVEQLLEDESLTDDLVDEAASVLLDWGIRQLDAAFRGSDGLSPPELRRCSSRLRRMMRRINERVGRCSADQQAERVRMILSRIEEARDVYNAGG
jgi:hypothetical protein